MAWCLGLPLDVQQQINYMRFQGTPSARAIKAFEIGADREFKISVVAKRLKDYILVPNKNGGRWRNGAWRGAPLTSRSPYIKITRNGMRRSILCAPLPRWQST